MLQSGVNSFLRVIPSGEGKAAHIYSLTHFDDELRVCFGTGIWVHLFPVTSGLPMTEQWKAIQMLALGSWAGRHRCDRWKRLAVGHQHMIHTKTL